MERKAMDRLPPEIQFDILARLPLKSLGISRCVSKKWNSIISHPSFISMQITHATHPHFLLSCKNKLSLLYQLYYVETNNPRSQTGNATDPIVLTANKMIDIPFIDPEHMIDFIVMGSCNGLVCVSFLRYPSFSLSLAEAMENLATLPSNPIYVLNAVTGEYVDLPHFTQPECAKLEEFMSGFGYDLSTQQYKLVLPVFYKHDVKSEEIYNELLVYTLGSALWRREIGVVPDVLIDACRIFCYICLDGVLYWVSMKDRDLPSCRPVIVSFDLGVEKFVVFSTPKLIVMNHEAQLPLEYITLGMLEGNLSLVDSSSKKFICVWLLKNDSGKKSWVKQFAINKNLVCQWPYDDVVPVKLQSNGELLLLCGSKYMVSFNMRTKICKRVKFDGVPESGSNKYEVVPAVGSLISLKSVCGVGRDTKDINQAGEMHHLDLR